MTDTRLSLPVLLSWVLCVRLLTTIYDLISIYQEQ
jgi:hypothetical protein